MCEIWWAANIEKAIACFKSNAIHKWTWLSGTSYSDSCTQCANTFISHKHTINMISAACIQSACKCGIQRIPRTQPNIIEITFYGHYNNRIASHFFHPIYIYCVYRIQLMHLIAHLDRFSIFCLFMSHVSWQLTKWMNFHFFNAFSAVAINKWKIFLDLFFSSHVIFFYCSKVKLWTPPRGTIAKKHRFRGWDLKSSELESDLILFSI